MRWASIAGALGFLAAAGFWLVTTFSFAGWSLLTQCSWGCSGVFAFETISAGVLCLLSVAGAYYSAHVATHSRANASWWYATVVASAGLSLLWLAIYS